MTSNILNCHKRALYWFVDTVYQVKVIYGKTTVFDCKKSQQNLKKKIKCFIAGTIPNGMNC